MDIKETGYQLQFDDPSRKNFLYSAFPTDRDVNPKHWDSKLAFWSAEIKQSAKQLNDVCVDVKKLEQRFCNGSKVPLGLNIVMNELINNGTLVPLESYSKVFGDSWLNWAFQVSTASASWMWRKVAGQNEDTKEYAILQHLKDKAEQLLEEHSKRCACSRTDMVVPFAVILRYKLDNLSIDEKTATLIIGYLKQQGKVQAIMDESGQKIVKFAAKGGLKAEKFKEEDFQILKLKQTIARLQLEMKKHLKEAESLRNKAKEVISSDKAEAKRLLKEARSISKSVRKKEDQLILLNDQLNKVKDFDSQKMVVEALDSSATLLNNILKDEDLSISNVESVVTKADEALEDFRELDNAISEGLLHLEQGEGIDMSDLERELLDLLPTVPDEIREDVVTVPPQHEAACSPKSESQRKRINQPRMEKSKVPLEA